MQIRKENPPSRVAPPTRWKAHRVGGLTNLARWLATLPRTGSMATPPSTSALPTKSVAPPPARWLSQLPAVAYLMSTGSVDPFSPSCEIELDVNWKVIDLRIPFLKHILNVQSEH